ncbi:MAG: HPr family phosphocarrier protein [Pyrinomonadaceae bacterium]
MLERRIRVINELGLHARAAAQLVRLAATFGAVIILKRDDTGVESNARSILDILYLAAGKGIELKITFEGTDEIEAANAIAHLFLSGFGEM